MSKTRLKIPPRLFHPVFLSPEAIPLIVSTMTSCGGSAAGPSKWGRARRRRVCRFVGGAVIFTDFSVPDVFIGLVVGNTNNFVQGIINRSQAEEMR